MYTTRFNPSMLKLGTIICVENANVLSCLLGKQLTQITRKSFLHV